MLLLENVQKTFNKGTVNEKKALTGVKLNMNSRDFVTVIGGNGAGKSTMLNMVAGVYPIDKGKIVLNGKDLTREPEHKRAKYISRVFQDPMMGTAANMEIQRIWLWLIVVENGVVLPGASPEMKRSFWREVKNPGTGP